MKQSNKLSLFAILLLTALLAAHCTHDDAVEVIEVNGPDPITHGTETFSCTDCTPLEANGASRDFSAGDVPAGQWYFDKSHSNVMWSSPYKVFGADLTGRFNYFVVSKLSFDEADPASLEFEGYVRLNTVNTGEPGRDAGCLLGTFGTDAAYTTEMENKAMLVSKPGTGRYSTIDEAFLVDATLTFHGNSKDVTVALYYRLQSDQGSYTMAGINAKFNFHPLSDFAIETSNIDDDVLVEMNMIFRNKSE